MEQKKNQQHQSGNMNTNQQSGSDMQQQQMQHRSDVMGNDTQSGNNNPQDGSDWSNYRNRSLSGNSEQQQQKK